jgi:hypothetical protein
VLGSEIIEGEVWYRVKGPPGEGWVTAESLNLVAGADQAVAGFAVGDTAYLVGRGFLINLAPEPGSNTIHSNTERGALVTVLEVRQVEGVNWYKIRATSGEGWVPESNLSAEKP